MVAGPRLSGRCLRLLLRAAMARGLLGCRLVPLALAASLHCGAPAAAEADVSLPARPPAGSEIQVFVENDVFARTDRYYTNGIKFGLGVPLDALQVPAQWLLERVAPMAGDVHLGLFVGQNLYTPKSIGVAAPQPADRPWAAWLYLGGVAQRARGNRLDTVEIDIGMVGPAALGNPVQSRWHRLIGSPQPQGWSNQIPNEPAFLASYLQKRKYAWRDGELIPHGGATLGTVMTLARLGGIVRYGRNMTGYGPDTVEPGGAMLQSMHSADEAGAAGRFEWYLFAGVDQRLVARNIFLDGTAFRDSPSVARHRRVHDLLAGLSVRLDKLRISLTRVRRSEEFATPFGGGGRQTFDSLNLGLEF